MASPLQFKVYSATEMTGSVRYAEDAAAIVHDGGHIAWEGRKVWREGRETQPAGESYDYVAHVIFQRIRAINARTEIRRRVGMYQRPRSEVAS